ncbi:hypothetical protein HYC85_004346 [Camellia sinensis]|uniref:Uncharacterized protein n=1 Tax=Camellia sinensis TaxID=4442 RepID=A0A7J7HY07_CAMSI|nr:hypothetical protein HYC85_004346 [Camellia sinensis]
MSLLAHITTKRLFRWEGSQEIPKNVSCLIFRRRLMKGILSNAASNERNPFKRRSLSLSLFLSPLIFT